MAVKDLKLHPENIAKFQFPETPPWTLTPLIINLEIANTKKRVKLTRPFTRPHTKKL